MSQASKGALAFFCEPEALPDHFECFWPEHIDRVVDDEVNYSKWCPTCQRRRF